MWSCERSTIGRRRLLAGFGSTCFGLLCVTGCEVRPLYGERRDTGRSTADEIAQVEIKALPDRTGQQFNNLLRDRLNPRGLPAEPLYVLEIRLSETISELALRRDETATRANLKLRADYQLRRKDDKRVVLNGFAQSVNSYNILESQFATQIAEQNARERGLRELSDDIRARLAVYLLRAGWSGEG